MTRPVLGIVCCTRTVGVEPAQAVMSRYVESAIRFADAAALLVPSLPALMNAREIVGRLDGVLLTGSPSNVDPARYGDGGAEDAEGSFDPARDATTADLIGAMTDLGKPVFGICRGLQEINVAFGGKLRRDVSSSTAPIHHHAPGGASFDAMFDHRHDIALQPGGILHAAFGQGALSVNSVHFQGIGELGHGLSVEARAPDGLIEALSTDINGAPVLAVQWHPEWDAETSADSRIFFQLLGRALRGLPIKGYQP